MTTQYARVTRLWRGQGWVENAVLAFDDEAIWLAPGAQTAGEPVGVLPATVLPPLTDAHVHLGLSNYAASGGGALARVLDLGWHPPSLRPLVAAHRQTEVVYAGPFLTAVGGYPSTRPWAPEGSVTEVAGVEEAMRAVDDVCDLGARVVKVTLNTEVGPVFSDDELRVLVNHAHHRGRPVVAHVEGAGQPQRAVVAGVDVFAHTPWTDRLADDELAAMAGTVVWISTLDMHGRGRYGDDYARALDNLTRFVAAGGTVVYGTDLGNDLEHADLNPREIAALRSSRLDPMQLIDAMTATGFLPSLSRSRTDESPSTVTLLPAEVVDPADVVDALPSSRPVHASALKEYVQ